MRGMFRHPVFYDDKTLGKENTPLLYTTGMANDYNGSILQREEHYNPAIYPKPSYSIKGVEPVSSGTPNWGTTTTGTVNGQQYTFTAGMPTKNSDFDQFQVIPASAMPGPSAENVFVDTPDSVWMQNYKNKMNLYDVTQQNLARLKEYDPNYNVVTNYDVSDPRYDPYQKFDSDPSNTRTDRYNKRMEGYEQRYVDDPSVGFYQAGPTEEINEPCVGCGTLYGSKKSADANTTYRTYDVQYPEKGVYSKKDLERSKQHYTIKESGNPGQSYLWKYTDDGKGGYMQELQGSVFNRDFLNDEQQVQYDAPTGGTWVVNYDPNVDKGKVYQDQHIINKTIEDERGWEQRDQNNLNREQQRIEQEKAYREQWEKEQREKQKKRIAGANGQYAYGGTTGPGKPKIDFASKTKSSDENYLYKQTYYQDGTSENKNRRTLKGFITGAPKPGEAGGPPKLANGGAKMVKIKSLPKAQDLGQLTPEQRKFYDDRYIYNREYGFDPNDSHKTALRDASYFNTGPILNFQPFLPDPDSGLRIPSGKRYPLEYIDWNTYKPFDEAMYDPSFSESYWKVDPELQARMKDQVESDYTAENYYNSLKKVKDWEKSWYTKRAQLPQFTDIANKRLSLISDVNMQPITKSDFSVMVPNAGAAYMPDKNEVLIPTNSWRNPSTFVHERSHWFDWNAPQNDDMYNGSYFRSYLKPGNSVPNPVYNYEDETLNNIIPSEYKLPYGVVDPLRLGENDTNTYNSESEKL